MTKSPPAGSVSKYHHTGDYVSAYELDGRGTDAQSIAQDNLEF